MVANIQYMRHRVLVVAFVCHAFVAALVLAAVRKMSPSCAPLVPNLVTWLFCAVRKMFPQTQIGHAKIGLLIFAAVRKMCPFCALFVPFRQNVPKSCAAQNLPFLLKSA